MANSMTCPHCGGRLELVVPTEQEIELTPERRVIQTVQRGHETTTRYTTLGDSTRSKFGEVASAPVPKFSRAERTYAGRAASKEADVDVPLFQALLTGVLVGIPIGVGLTLRAHWPWYAVPIITTCVTSAMWIILLYRHQASLWVHEIIENEDKDGDGYIGPPPRQEWRVQGEIRHEHGDRPASLSLFDLPCPSPDDLRAFARGILAGRASFSELSAAKYHYGPLMWEELRDDFINRGWAFWKHPTVRQQGVGLTEAGQATISIIADAPLP